MGRITEENRQQQAQKDARYWLYEEPEVYTTGRNSFRLYKAAGKLQIALPDYVVVTRAHGEQREELKPGKLAALDLEALQEDPETLEWLLAVLKKLQ